MAHNVEPFAAKSSDSASLHASFMQPVIRRWLLLAVLMLVASGIFSLIVVFARTPGLYNLPHIQKLFHEALVIHVDLLVLCWPLCIGGMMWAAFCPSKLSASAAEKLHGASMALIVLGALCLTLAPLDFAAEPLKNNYIPIITSPIFTYGLLMLALAALALAAQAVFFNKRSAAGDVSFTAVANWGARGAALITLFSLVALWIGFRNTSPDGIDLQHYYESAIWAGGHLYQFAFTQLQMLAWLWIILRIKPGAMAQNFRAVRSIMLLNAALGCAGIYGIMRYDTLSFEYNQFYTLHMIVAGGIAPCLMMAWLGWYMYSQKKAAAPALPASSQRHLYPALIVSIALFLYGGVLGLLIQGQDVTIPAHYHGATISITIALMGFAYAYVPLLSTNPLPRKWMTWQPIIYGVGQFMHITGLAVSGGYGVLRKTPGLEEGFTKAKFAMAVMGGGGLLAVIGGLLFVYIMWLCFRRNS